MPWTYNQQTGVLTDRSGDVAASNGYSGSGRGRNNRAMEREAETGPIPRGSYRIGTARQSAETGAASMALIPTGGTNTFGRGSFAIHGDSRAALHGCVILGRDVRNRISESTDRILIVQ